MARTKKPVEAIETPSLERMVMECDYRTRDAALASLRGAVAPILNPRELYRLAGSSEGHFLPLPQSPRTGLNRRGTPEPAEAKEEAEYRRKLAELSQRERALTDAAQRANGVANALQAWVEALGVEGDRLLISSLNEDDRPTVLAYVAAHNRFVRTCQSWAEKLAY